MVHWCGPVVVGLILPSASGLASSVSVSFTISLTLASGDASASRVVVVAIVIDPVTVVVVCFAVWLAHAHLGEMTFVT